MWQWFPMLQKQKHVICFHVHRYQGKRVQFPVEWYHVKAGIETEGDGEGMTYRFFPSPRLVEVKRTYSEVYNILFVVTTLNIG